MAFWTLLAENASVSFLDQTWCALCLYCAIQLYMLYPASAPTQSPRLLQARDKPYQLKTLLFDTAQPQQGAGSFLAYNARPSMELAAAWAKHMTRSFSLTDIHAVDGRPLPG